MPADDLIAAPAQGAHVEEAGHAHRQGDVVGRALGLELGEDQQPLLGKGGLQRP